MELNIVLAVIFGAIVVVGDNIKVRRDENGIATIGLRNFLLDEDSLRL